MAEGEPPPLDYAGRTRDASGVIDEETRSLGEGCLAVTLLVVGLPVVILVVLIASFGCLGFLFVGLR